MLNARSFAVALPLIVVARVATTQEQPVSWRATAKTAAFAEIGGSVGLYSLNLDRKLNSNVTIRVGSANYSSIEFGDQPRRNYQMLAVLVNVLTGGPTAWWEMGLGPRLGKYRLDGSTGIEPRVASITTTFGYRYQPSRGGLVFRAVLSPQFELRGPNERATSWWPGVSVGFAF